MPDIIMPKLSDTMTEGRFGAWKKSVGDRIERGEVIAEVETDKAVMELEAYTSGILREIRVKAGEVVTVGSVIGVIDANGEETETHLTAPPPEETAVSVPPSPADSAGRLPEPPPVTHTTEHHEGRAAPAVRRHAHDLGIDLTRIQGSGPGGRVLMKDLDRAGVGRVMAAPEAGTTISVSEEPESLPSEVSSPLGSEGGLPLSRMRAAIARTVTDSWQHIPHFSVTVEVAMEAAVEVRRELKQAGIHLSLNDLIIKAAALALKKHPRVNSSFDGDRITTHDAINIGVAVALTDGLLVPVVRGCDLLQLLEIAAESRRLVAAARSGTLSEYELTGGTFTVSNLGPYNVTQFSAVILPPQSAILAAGSVRDVVVPRNGTAVIAPVMNLTLSADHRVLDGASAAGFMAQIRQFLENPVLLLA